MWETSAILPTGTISSLSSPWLDPGLVSFLAHIFQYVFKLFAIKFAKFCQNVCKIFASMFGKSLPICLQNVGQYAAKICANILQSKRHSLDQSCNILRSLKMKNGGEYAYNWVQIMFVQKSYTCINICRFNSLICAKYLQVCSSGSSCSFSC